MALQALTTNPMRNNNAVHTEPSIARFANEKRFSGGPVTAADQDATQCNVNATTEPH